MDISVAIYQWLNIPYHGSEAEREGTNENGDENDNDGDIDDGHLQDESQETQIQDYNINADIKLAKMAYNGLLYPRLGAAILMTFALGAPVLRISLMFK